MTTPDDILKYWIDELGEKGWYEGGADLDEQIREKFEPAWRAAVVGGLRSWMTYPGGVLAFVILTDQMSRNMFRGTAGAYASDRQARAAAHFAIDRGWDMKIDEPARQFFYMPLEHSECLADQDRAVRLMATRMPSSDGLLLHARAHREIIRRFGRFPFRNDHLGRASSEAERQFMEKGAYRGILETLSARAA
jgi:uncharacterized protein (DUF924 family)